MDLLKKYREQILMSKAELARKAEVSVLTINCIEEGKSCRPETKRKIVVASDLELSDANRIFGRKK